MRMRLKRIQDILSFDSPAKIYHHMLSHWHSPKDVIIGGMEPLTTITDQARWANLPGFQQQMMYLDLVTYLPDDILVKVDRASMAVSLEARVPLLDDHRVVEFAWSLPHHMKVRDGTSKWALRQVLNRYVPSELIERPKMGFGVPIDSWLRGPCDHGQNLCSTRAACAMKAISIPSRSARYGRNIWKGKLTGSTLSGIYSCSRHGSK